MTDRQRKKDLVAEYKQTFRPMGVYQIRNLDNGKIFVAGSMNLDAARNRHEFTSTRAAQPPIPELHADWTSATAAPASCSRSSTASRRAKGRRPPTPS